MVLELLLRIFRMHAFWILGCCGFGGVEGFSIQPCPSGIVGQKVGTVFLEFPLI